MPTTVLTDKTLQQFVDSNPVAVIRFHASWCSACKMFGPVFKSVADSYKGAAFAEVDTDRQPVAARYFQIQSLPTTVIIKGGKIVERHSGSMDPNRFVNWLNKGITPQAG